MIFFVNVKYWKSLPKQSDTKCKWVNTLNLKYYGNSTSIESNQLVKLESSILISGKSQMWFHFGKVQLIHWYCSFVCVFFWRKELIFASFKIGQKIYYTEIHRLKKTIDLFLQQSPVEKERLWWILVHFKI